MKEFFSIGEVSKLFDINKKTLRYYDEIDLFKPSFVNKENKYRYYTLDQFQYLETIKYLKELGLSLEKIKHHLNNINSQEVDFEERQAVRLRHSIKTDYDIELSLRKLIKMSDNKIFLTYGLVGISIAREDLLKGQFDEYKSIFVMIEEEKYDENLIKTFQKGAYVCIRFKGIHKDAPPYYKKLINYINEQGYEILDDSLEMELTDPSLSLSDEEVVTELQILVKK